MIINEDRIRRAIQWGNNTDFFDEMLAVASDGNGLTLRETSVLFQGLNADNLSTAKRVAEDVRVMRKGQDAALYTCSYITNMCVNNCGYCGYRRSNDALRRITLTPDEIRVESRAINASGVTNAILIGGTLPEEDYKDLILEGTRITLEEGLNPWIEFENLSFVTLDELNVIGANHFLLFQETYDKARYERAHRDSPLKSDYDARLREVDVALDEGFNNIGIGALFGLTSDYLFEVLGLHQHTHYLWEKGANICISVPTLKPAPGLNINRGDAGSNIERIVTTLRLALPSVSLALSGRELGAVRDRLFGIVDQIGSGGAPNPGGRTTYRGEYNEGHTQFLLYEERTPRQITAHLKSLGINVEPQVNWG